MTVVAFTSAPSHVSPSYQQVSVTQPPVPPVPPSGPGVPSPAPSPSPFGVQLPGSDAIIPLTRDQVEALSRRGDALSDQLQSAQSRRDDIARELENATQPANRAGLEERLRFLDQRILTLEQDINANSQARASLEANYSETGDANDGDGGSSTVTVDGNVGVIAFMVLFPISLAIARAIWRRTTRREVPVAPSQSDARFAQLEQAIDTVAVEIERVAEGQRYVTRMLREGQPVPDFQSGRESTPVSVRSRAEEPR